MKIAVPICKKNLESKVEFRFGRADKFLIYDSINENTEVIDNSQNLNASQGAGIQAAQNILKKGVTRLICGHCGPKAFKVLKQANVKVFTVKNSTVEDAIDMVISGKLEELTEADVEGHWV